MNIKYLSYLIFLLGIFSCNIPKGKICQNGYEYAQTDSSPNNDKDTLSVALKQVSFSPQKILFIYDIALIIRQNGTIHFFLMIIG